MPSRSLFAHTEDRLPVAIIVSLTGLDFLIYLTVESFWVVSGYWLLMLIPKGIIGAWAHHHQHCPTFRSTPLNRLLELSHALHTGQTTNLWVLHHVFGHHLNYLDQDKDESRWKRRSGRTMGVLEYTFEVAVTSYYRAYQVGKMRPRYLPAFLFWTTATALLVLTLVAFKPWHGFFLFALPMAVSMLWTAWVTYDHHAGLETDDPLQASFNIMNPWYNRITGNLGYHTAHHMRQGVHWAQLPAVHAELEPGIPAHLYRRSAFDAFLPDDDLVVAPEAQVETQVSATP